MGEKGVAAGAGWLGRASGMIGFVSSIVAVVATGVTILHTIESDDNQKRAAQSAAQAAKSQIDITNQLNRAKDDRDRILSVYKEVTEALEKGDARRERLATKLVQFYITSSSEHDLQYEMLGVLRVDAKDPDVRETAAAAQFKLQETQPTLGTSAPVSAPVLVQGRFPLGSYNVDVFWCQSSPPNTEATAQAIVDNLSSATSGRVRSRILPNSVRQGSYSVIGAAEIRRENNPSERPLVEPLRSLTADTLIKAHVISSPGAITVRDVTAPTPGYVSLFVCPK